MYSAVAALASAYLYICECRRRWHTRYLWAVAWRWRRLFCTCHETVWESDSKESYTCDRRPPRPACTRGAAGPAGVEGEQAWGLINCIICMVRARIRDSGPVYNNSSIRISHGDVHVMMDPRVDPEFAFSVEFSGGLRI
jgi:hypothetical protein